MSQQLETQIAAEVRQHQIDIARRDYEGWQARLDYLEGMWEEACRGEASAKRRLIELGALPPAKTWAQEMAEVDAELLAKGAM